MVPRIRFILWRVLCAATLGSSTMSCTSGNKKEVSSKPITFPTILKTRYTGAEAIPDISSRVPLLSALSTWKYCESESSPPFYLYQGLEPTNGRNVFLLCKSSGPSAMEIVYYSVFPANVIPEARVSDKDYDLLLRQRKPGITHIVYSSSWNWNH